MKDSNSLGSSDAHNPAADPLGPVTYAEAEALRPDFPSFPSLAECQWLSWSAKASSPEARALISALVQFLGLQTPEEAKAKRGPKPTTTDAEALEAMIGDLLRHAANGSWSVQPTATGAFTDHPFLGATTFNRVFKALEAAKLVEKVKGYKFSNNASASKMRGTKALFQRAQWHGISWRDANKHFRLIQNQDPKARPPVVLRPLEAILEDGETLDTAGASPVGSKPTLPLPDTEAAKSIVAQVEAFNAFVQGFRIESGPSGSPDIWHPQFHRVFHGDFRHYGRLHARGASYQGLPGPSDMRDPSTTRASLRINGEPVVELDIHASGLTVAHALLGVPLPVDRADLYELPGISRDAGKRWLTAYLGKGEPLKNWPGGTDDALKAQSLKAIQGAFLEEYPFLKDLARTLGVQDHPKLAGFLLSAKEAEAVLGAVFELMDRGILALPIHDSIIVQAKHQDVAMETLVRNYRDVVGVAPRVRTKGPKGGRCDA